MVVGLAVLALAAGSLVAVLFLRDSGSETSAAGAGASITPQTSPTGSPEPTEEATAAAAKSAAKVYDLGTLKGAATIWGPPVQSTAS